jgi:fluoroquinolone transport system permease protein
VVALVIAWAALGRTVDTPLLTAAVALTAAVFAAVGLAAAAVIRGLDRFVVWGGLGSAIFGLPVLPYLGVLESPLWWLVPTHPALTLLARATGAPAASDAPSALQLLVLTAWAVLAFVIARRCIARRALGRSGRDA